MDSFWNFARRMLRYRLMLVMAIVAALFSASSLTAGFIAAEPVVSAVVGEGPSLPELATRLNENPIIDGRIPDSVIGALPDGGFTAVVVIVSALGILAVFGQFATFLHAYLALTVIHRTVTNIRREAFHVVIRFPLKQVLAGGTIDSVSRIVNDTTTLAGGFNALLSKAIANITKGAAAFIAALVIEWRLTVIALCIAPIIYTIIRKLGKRIRRASRSALSSQADLYGVAVEVMQGMRVVKVHTTERYEAGRFHRINKEVMRDLMRVRTARAIASPLVGLLGMFAFGIMAVVAIKAVDDGHITPQNFVLVMGALGVAGAALKPLTGLVNDIQASAAAADRIEELLRIEREPGHGARLPKLARHSISIEFKDVTFTYPNADRAAIRNVNLIVRHGETVAIVGPNGSGKTTLLALVPRLFDPDSRDGQILIDSEDIREYSVRSLRRQIGVVTQETIIFRGTIGSNISYGAEGVTQEKVVEAAKMARAHEFISRLPDGYDTVVGEQGLTLSGGQRQRVAIARAVLRDPAILILDEATSMIDADSEAKIAEAIADFTTGRTCMIVAHRLSTVVGADRIIVMDEGQIVDQGQHEELLDRCETYKLIARHQLVRGTVS